MSELAYADEAGRGPHRQTATTTIGRGLSEAPVLRQGLGVTWLFAATGAAGRVVVPVVVQQAIDRGIDGRDGVKMDFVITLAVIGAIAQLIAAVCTGIAINRLGTRSEAALAQASERLAAHLAAHPDTPLTDVAFTLACGRRAFASPISRSTSSG